MKNDARSHQKWENRATGVPKSEPKGTKSEPKGSHREPKTSHRATKMHPKVDVRNILAKWNENGSVGHSFWEPFGYHFPLKMHIKANANFNAEKLQTFMRKCSQNHAKTRPKINDNLWIFGTCDFLFLAKSITLKSFFHMIRGTRIP